MVTIKNRTSNWVACWCVALLAAACFTACTPPGPQALLNGKELMDKGDYTAAVEQFKTATSLMETNALAWHFLGLALQKTGQPSAEQAYLRALSLDRDLTEVRYNLGCLYSEQNRLEEAKTQFTAFNLRNSNTIDGLLKLGSIQLRTREVGAAEKTFAEALRIRPQQPEAMNGLGLVRLLRGRAAEAALVFSNTVYAHPDYAPALLNLAIVRHQSLKDREGALEAYRDYLAIRPAPANAAAVLAVTLQLEQETAASRPMAPATTVVSQVTTSAPQPKVTSVQPTVPPAAAAQPTPRVTAPEPISSPKQQPMHTQVQLQPVVRQAQTTPPPKTTPPAQTEPKKATPQQPAANPPPVAARTEPPKKTTPPAQSAANQRPTTQPTPVQAAPVQNVVLKPEPVPRIAQDALPEKRPLPTVAKSQPPGEKPDSGLLVTTSNVPNQVTAAKPRRSLLQTLNPANLFRGDAEQQPGASPGSASAGGAAKPAPAVVKEAEASLPELRYRYRDPSKPTPGNQVEADRALAQGVQAHNAQNLQGAAQAYRKATEADPSYFEAQYNLGLASAALGNTDAALNAYEDALAILPTSTDARYNFALALRQGGYWRDAANELERILAQHPNEIRARLALGNLYAKDYKQPAKARPHYAKVLELEPKHPQASALRFWLSAHPAP